MNIPLKVLMLEDDSSDFELALRELTREGFAALGTRVEAEADFRDQLERSPPDLILADYSLPQYDGLSALNVARDLVPHIPFLFVSGSLGEQTAIEALKHGATDFVLKDDLARLGPCARRALQEARERVCRQAAEAALRQSEEHFRLVAETASDAIVSAGEDGRISFWNHAAETIFGYSAAEAIGRPLSLLLPERSRQDEVLRARLQASGPSPRAYRALETSGVRQDGREFPMELSLASWHSGPGWFLTAIIRDNTWRHEIETERERLIAQLHAALAEVRSLSGIIPICANCGKLRDDQGAWSPVAEYLRAHTPATVSHGLCPDCSGDLYPEAR